MSDHGVHQLLFDVFKYCNADERTVYKLVALGLGTVYAFQVFLTIGGVTKFIPSTGVTLPLVSYGGSSLLATMMLFAVIQGLYILRQDEGENNARKKQRKTGYERQQVEELY